MSNPFWLQQERGRSRTCITNSTLVAGAKVGYGFPLLVNVYDKRIFSTMLHIILVSVLPPDQLEYANFYYFPIL